MPRPESGPAPVVYPILGVFLGFMFGWTIAVIFRDQPFESIQGGFGTSGFAFAGTAWPYCLWSWLVAILGGILGYRISRLP